jgi:hypothetical protein
MKNLIYGSLLLALVGIGVISCVKEVVTDTVQDKSLNETINLEKAAGPGIRIFTVQLDRPAGKTNKYGVDCDCAMCGGFCDFEWFPDFSYNPGDDNSKPTVAVELIDSKKAKLYFFETLDVDNVDNPIFHIDSNVKIDDGVLVTELVSGEYPVTNEKENILYKDGTLVYSSYITVDLN